MQTNINPASAGSELWKVKVRSPPAAPAASIAISGANVTLLWNAVTGPVSYQVIRSETPYSKPNNTSLFLNRLEPGGQVHVHLREGRLNHTLHN